MLFKRPPSLWLFSTVLVAALLTAGCKPRRTSEQLNYAMGERITAGPLVYNVVQTVWRTQLGDVFKTRVPDDRYLLISLSVTNSSADTVSVPFFQLEGPNRKTYSEIEDGTGIDNWFGLLRDITPAQTKQGNIVFDVPLTSFRLRLTDGGEPGTEKYVWVDIPLRMDTDSTISTPLPGPAENNK
jgi:hypothetical protein